MNTETSTDTALSSDEIEALVEHAESSDFDDGLYRTHDFSGGQSLTLSKWSELNVLCEKQAEALQSILASEFGAPVEISAQAKRFRLAGDIIAASPTRLCLVSSAIDPFEHETHLLLAGDLLTVLVNQYFGGGQLPAPEMRKRVTPSEQRVGERVAREFFRVMNEIWSDRLPLGFGDLFIDITTDRFSLIPDRTGFAVLPFEVRVSDGPAHTIDLLIPFDSLEAESTALTPKVLERPVEPETSWGADIRAALPEVSVDVSGEIGNVTTTLRALLAMGVGTVVPIDEPERVLLSLEGRAIAEGKYGAHEGFKAMQFTNFNGDLS